MARHQQFQRRGESKHRSASGPPTRDKRRGLPNPRRQGHGPQTCPMCGIVVNDLKYHIQAKHDDAASHPRG